MKKPCVVAALHSGHNPTGADLTLAPEAEALKRATQLPAPITANL